MLGERTTARLRTGSLRSSSSSVRNCPRVNISSPLLVRTLPPVRCLLAYLILRDFTAIAPWFIPTKPGGGFLRINKEVGDLVDWYNMQFYNRKRARFCRDA